MGTRGGGKDVGWEHEGRYRTGVKNSGSVECRTQGIGGEEGWIWEGRGEFWETGVKTGTKATVETRVKLPLCFNKKNQGSCVGYFWAR